MDEILKDFRGESTLIDFENEDDDEILYYLASKIDEGEIKRNMKFLMFHAFKNRKRKTFDALLSYADDPGKYIRNMGYEMYVENEEDYGKIKKYLDFSVLNFYPVEKIMKKSPSLGEKVINDFDKETKKRFFKVCSLKTDF